MDKIFFRGGYKYVLAKTYTFHTPLRLNEGIITPYISLKADGALVISKGYAWDGPSGPTFDTPSFMRGSLIHDAFYQLMREGHLNVSYKQIADEILRDVCIEDGMSKIRAWWVYQAVSLFGKNGATKDIYHKVVSAP